MKEALYFVIPSDLHSAISVIEGAEGLVELIVDFGKNYYVFIFTLIPHPHALSIGYVWMR